MLWGLDTEVGKIDERQRDFFKSLKQNGENPREADCLQRVRRTPCLESLRRQRR